MKRTKIVDVLKSTDFGKEVCVKGWVRTHRSSKAVDFIALNDGSTIKNVQVVVDPAKFDEELLKQMTTGSCICAVGTLVESQRRTDQRDTGNRSGALWCLRQYLSDAEEGTVV